MNCVYRVAYKQTEGISVSPTNKVENLSPEFSFFFCFSSALSIEPAALQPAVDSFSAAGYIVAQLFCCTAQSRSLAETMALIWIIKAVQHYDTVSLCRGGQRTNIQAHCLRSTVSPFSVTLFLVLAAHKLGKGVHLQEVVRPHRHLLRLGLNVKEVFKLFV